jgi:pimeloyl-ACP methyl ester carboxylesterase
MWERQLALADSGWRVLAPHFRGFGDGAADPAAASIDDYAGDVIDLLDALHVEQAVIGGLSMGGYVAFAVLRHAARYVQGLILADTKSGADTPQALEGRRKTLQTLESGGPAAVVDDLIPKLLGPTTCATRPDVVAHVRALAMASSADAVAGAVRVLMSRPDSTPLLAGIHVPTLILVGDEDAITPPSASEQMHASIAGSELVVITQSGHLSNLEQPELFDAAVGRFLAHRV